MCDKIRLLWKAFAFVFNLITVLTKVIAIVFVFENFIAFVISVFKYYAMYLDPSLVQILTFGHETTFSLTNATRRTGTQLRSS